MGVLVTGVGYIGAKLVADLVSEGVEVVGLDNLSATPWAQIRNLREKHGFTFVRGSILNRSTVREALSLLSRVDCVYHLAAQASANPEAATSRYTENANLLAPRIVFEEAARAGAQKIVFGSSLKIYGPHIEGHLSEHSPYGSFQDLSHLSKCYVEKLLEMTAHETGVPSVSVRLAIVYGLGPVMKADYRYMTAPNKFCLQVVRGEAIRVHPSAIGKLGFIHVDDASAALRLSAQIRTDAPYMAANAVSELCSVADVAAEVRSQAKERGLPCDVEGAPTEKDPACFTVSSILGDAGFMPVRRLADSLGEVMDYFAVSREAGRRS